MSTNQKKRVNIDKGEAFGGEKRSLYPMKKIFACLLVALTVSINASAQNFVPSIARIQDSTNNLHVCIIKADGSYFVTFQVDALRIESFGQLNIKGDFLTFEEVTPRYRVLVVADLRKGTGKVVVNYTGLGTMTILDKNPE
jgi:hypothetical protein